MTSAILGARAGVTCTNSKKSSKQTYSISNIGNYYGGIIINGAKGKESAREGVTV